LRGWFFDLIRKRTALPLDCLEVLDQGRAAQYDLHDEIVLSSLQPLIAKPSSPANVVPVREVAGADIYQAYIGSSANPGFRDFAIAATIVQGHEVHDRVSFDINPSSRHILQTLAVLMEGGAIDWHKRHSSLMAAKS
jgi:homoaconitase/3-isopropylmalate dehydratase large subunit